MNQRLSAKGRKKRGLWREGEDAMWGTLIEPSFYAILKEEGLPTSQKPDGNYWDKESQAAWEKWKSANV
jgi:hypothetical protein